MTPAIRPDDLPRSLRNIPQWVAWQSVDRGGGKPTKVPIDPATGRNASSTDPRTWGSFEQALERCNGDGLAGIGFVFTKQAGVVGVDLDKCREPESGALADWASRIVDQLDSYTEVSPSGTGLHVLLRGRLPDGRRRKGSFEVYDSARFFTMTGVRLNDRPPDVEERSSALQSVHESIFGSTGAESRLRFEEKTAGVIDEHVLVERMANGDMGERVARLWCGDFRGYPSQSEADLALCGAIAKQVGSDSERVDRIFRQSKLMRPKWDQSRGDWTYGQGTVRKALSTNGSSRRQGSTSAGLPRRHLTDTGNAERFVDLFRADVRFVPSWRDWIVWNERHWVRDQTGEAMRRTKAVIDALFAERQRCQDPDRRKAIAKWAMKSEHERARRAMLGLAQCESGIPVSHQELDRHPMLLNCRNGTLDLRRGELIEPQRKHLLTKASPVAFEPEAKCRTWERFLEQVLPDAQVRSFVRRAVGYSLTGDVSEQVLFFCHGSGANGKSTFMRVLLEILGGDYAIQAAPEILLIKKGQSHPTELTDLFGARVAVCTEIGPNRSLDEVQVKQLTGGDKIRARRMRQDMWEFEPSHHIWVAANHRPNVQGTDEAIWRRLPLIPFTVSIPGPERDRELLTKLQAELPGILAWAVRGCREWQEVGLALPEPVRNATLGYRKESDLVGGFFDDCIVLDPSRSVGATQLYEAYRRWSTRAGEEVLSQREFGKRMTERGFDRRKTTGRMVYRGLALLDAHVAGDEGRNMDRLPGRPAGARACGRNPELRP